MSPSQDYYDWLNSGGKWSPAKPIDDLSKTLRSLGYTVYIIGDDSHLKANLPEDHTPFSHTGWPGTSPKGRVLALDVMPSKGMADLVRLSRALLSAKRNNNVHAINFKYINWTDENGKVWHTSWEPNESTRASSDSGHIHLSIRTDYVDSGSCVNWNPLGTVVVPITNPSSPSERPAPGPVVNFPLPSGYYFGPKSGPTESVSGYYGRVFKGRTDTQWLQEWTNQLSRRGWSVGKGKSYLTQYGNDGHYGSEYLTLIRAFQQDQHLSVDGKLGVNTWNAAYHNPIS